MQVGALPVARSGTSRSRYLPDSTVRGGTATFGDGEHAGTQGRSGMEPSKLPEQVDFAEAFASDPDVMEADR
jgi:hypothetical protein